MNEAEFQANVIDLLQKCGYLIHHDRPAMKQDGTWVTAIQGHKGFPDIFAIHKRTGYILILELKGENGVVAPEQWQWMEALNQAHFIGAHGIAYPRHWDRLIDLVRQGAGLDPMPVHLTTARIPLQYRKEWMLTGEETGMDNWCGTCQHEVDDHNADGVCERDGCEAEQPCLVLITEDGKQE